MDPRLPDLSEVVRRARYLGSRFIADRCSENAAALTYMSLFALVPLLTVLYTMASAIPAFQGVEAQIQNFLYEHLVPQSSSEIQQYLDDFSQQAKNLTGPGLVFLLVTAILMLRNIEHALNRIWRARENRSALSSFLLYWAVLTLTPVTIGLALGLSTYLSSFAHAVANLELLGGKAYLVQVTPLLLSTLGFTLIYVAVPNCRVPIRHALIGGLFAALAFHAARGLFTQLMVGSSITFIYGAFAAVPLFLMWIYLSWNIVLVGGVLVHSLSAYQSHAQANRPAILKALDVLHVFWRKQQAGGAVREADLLNGRHDILRGMDSDTWGELRKLLMHKQLIAEDDSGNYLLCRDLHTVSLWQLKEWLDGERTLNGEHATGEGWQQYAQQLLRDQNASQRDILGISLAELYSR